MSKDAFSRLAGAIFLTVAAVHALRLMLKWQVTVAGWQVPMWVSAVGFILGVYLACEGLQIRKGN
jgi:hypothetical protein